MVLEQLDIHLYAPQNKKHKPHIKKKLTQNRS